MIARIAERRLVNGKLSHKPFNPMVRRAAIIISGNKNVAERDMVRAGNAHSIAIKKL